MFKKPTLVLNEAICRKNIELMVLKSKKIGVQFCPHFKTHQSIFVGRWFRDYGINKIAVSSVPMARYFAGDGWNDITIAFPFVSQQAPEINKLAKNLKLKLLVSSIGNALQLCDLITEQVGVYVEVDIGQNRSGVNFNHCESFSAIIQLLSRKPNIVFLGFLSHAGHSYHKPIQELETLNANAIGKLTQLKAKWINKFPSITISYGDTPTSFACENFEGIDEFRPGNFVFFDMQQAEQGICSKSMIAVALVCPVVSVYPQRCSAVIWGGSIHLSKDFYLNSNGLKSYGAVSLLNPDYTWSEPIEGLYIESLSQEHGMIKATNCEAINQLKEGDMLAILPAHSCLAVDCIKSLWLKGFGEVDVMRPA